MSRIDDLIKELAPKGVHFKTLGDTGEFIRGNGLQKSHLTSEGAPAIHYGQIHTHYGTWTDSTKSFTDPALAARLRRAKPGDLIIATTSEDDAAVAKATAWIGEGEVAVSGDAYIYRHTLDPRYVAYFFQTEQFQNQKSKHITGTKVRRVSGTALAKIRIPVPPLKVQHEIVQILDSFIELEKGLEKELEKELEARHLQYAHYRDELLAFSNNDTKRIPMGEAGVFFGGLTGKSKADFSNGNARFISYVNVFNNIAVDLGRDDYVRVEPGERQRALARGDVIFTGSSETPEDVGMSSVVTREVAQPTYLNSFSIGYRLHDPELLDPEFAKHLFRSSSMRQQIVKTASGVTRFNVSKARLAKVEFPVPSRDEQSHIAGILDNFEALVNKLSADLPAELAARQAQYEHYREMLLSFEDATA
ncbi:restriction endonuclease subunit S [Sinomonas notoginsengisoli]|uniref:restriction endonuclease subunit S n=1 Tax=Sinomonas notoginsengisoli TaxID=1457311 RepID=UPI001F2CDD7C|nr:restriction endonuclease subunit S [Sinomonas notoginsengisoli]